jgi:hypothetical protein
MNLIFLFLDEHVVELRKFNSTARKTIINLVNCKAWLENIKMCQYNQCEDILKSSINFENTSCSRHERAIQQSEKSSKLIAMISITLYLNIFRRVYKGISRDY